MPFGWTSPLTRSTLPMLVLQMLVLDAKHYYPANIYPIMIAAGGVAVEHWTRRLHALRVGLGTVAVAVGLVGIPYALPILTVESFLQYHRAVAPILHLETARNLEDGLLPRVWADMHGWPELTATVAQVYATLSPEERGKALIFASNYGEAAALEFLGVDYGLPPVVSGHNQYFLRGPGTRSADILISINGSCGRLLQLYRSSTLAATFTHPAYENNMRIRICRGLNQPLTEIWPKLKNYNNYPMAVGYILTDLIDLMAL